MTNDYIGFLTQGTISNEIVFQFGKRLKQSLHVDLISSFNMKSTNMIDSLVNEVLQRIKYKDKYLKNKVHEPYSDCNISSYIRQCLQTNSVMLPIFQKIFNKSLILIDYRMSMDLCRAVKQGFKSNPMII